MKTRFAPSPTGLIHIGNARTALFAKLLAMANDGSFLLRIEDSDYTRSEQRFVDALQQDLSWLGASWDEGPEVGGAAAPYFQAQRDEVYQGYYHQLEQAGSAYPCFCSEEQLEISRKMQARAGKAPRYSGRCVHLSAAERQEKLDQGMMPTLRFKLPKGRTITFVDLVKGKQWFDSDDLGDFIIRRANGTPAFMYCNAIDDSMMSVTHVLRGEDHVTNTPRQLMILEALGLTVPAYGHISLIVGSDGSPLSKRHGSRSVQQLREEGYLALALDNYMARLGHYYPDNELLTLQQLAAQFTIDSLGKAAARYEDSQLLHWQKKAVMTLNDTELWQWLQDSVTVPTDKRTAFIQLVRENCCFPAEAQQLAEQLFVEPIFDEAAQQVLQQAGAAFFTTAVAAVKSHGNDFAAIKTELMEKLALKGKKLFMPLRIAVTGQNHGPDMRAIFALFDAEQLQQRFIHAAQQVENHFSESGIT
ncbi:MAG: glutamate--tRNA ligase [Gammaproteobacteria bacterium]|nr:glutamate--tRNA ligase [Gammaproteobacteria bacterium]